jgi:hypothetical protein
MMTVSEENTAGTDVDTDTATEEQSDEYDIIRILVGSGHHARKLENGISLAIRLSGIPDTKGVHVEVVHVLDLRCARFGKSLLGMKSYVLDVINRPLNSILNELSIDNYLITRSLRTIWGKVPLNLLAADKTALKKNKASMIHETRTVYVVSDSAKPSLDLTWITDSSRILSIGDFAVARSSDARSTLPELKRGIDTDKWDALQQATLSSLYSLVGLSIIALTSLSTILAYFEKSWIYPIAGLALVLSVWITLYFSYTSRKHVNIFRESLKSESSRLSEIGDLKRIGTTMEINEEQLTIINELNFVIPTLVGSTIDSFTKGDYAACIHYTSVILDECVRLSPIDYTSEHNPFKVDKGLSRFLGLFQHLEVLFEDGEVEELALAYSAITGYPENSITVEGIVHHLTNINYVLFNAGLMSPQLKNRVDDVLNSWGMRLAEKRLSSTSAKIEPTPKHSESSVQNEESDSVFDEAVAADYMSTLDYVRESNVEEMGPELHQESDRPTNSVSNIDSSHSADEIPYRHRKLMASKKTEGIDVSADIQKKAEEHLKEIQDCIQALEDDE